MTWSTIRDGMQARLATVTGLTTSSYSVNPENIVDNTAAIVLPDDPLFEPICHGGDVAVGIKVLLRARRDTVESAQDTLDGLFSPIITAVWADRTLSGTVADIRYVKTERYTDENDPHVFAAAMHFQAMAVI